MTKRVLLFAALLILVPQQIRGDHQQTICLCKFVAPEYTQFARQTHVVGSVRVTVEFDASGKPTKTKVLPPAGYPLPSLQTRVLGRAAQHAVAGWQFCPSLARSSTNEIVITFNFNLTETPGTEYDKWSPTAISFESPATVNVTTTAYRVIAHSQAPHRQ